MVLPDHLHCMLELPENDSNYSLRWRLIKSAFSKSVPATEFRSTTRRRRNERGIWQRRFWETLITNEKQYVAYMDYLHFNPVKHELVESVKDWPYSSFHSCVESGSYPEDWAGGMEKSILRHIE